MIRRGMPWREFRDDLREDGWDVTRVTGSHEIWRSRYGEAFVVIRNHMNDPVSDNIIAQFRRLLARRREPESPALLGGTRAWCQRPGPLAGALKPRTVSSVTLPSPQEPP